MIEFEGLAKRYGSFQALAPLELSIPRGEVFGFLGPNGAGKTTTIRLMMGILVPSAGAVRIDSFDCHADGPEVKRRGGYLPDSPIFYDYLRGREILQFEEDRAVRQITDPPFDLWPVGMAVEAVNPDR